MPLIISQDYDRQEQQPPRRIFIDANTPLNDHIIPELPDIGSYEDYARAIFQLPGDINWGSPYDYKPEYDKGFRRVDGDCQINGLPSKIKVINWGSASLEIGTL